MCQWGRRLWFSFKSNPDWIHLGAYFALFSLLLFRRQFLVPLSTEAMYFPSFFTTLCGLYATCLGEKNLVLFLIILFSEYNIRSLNGLCVLELFSCFPGFDFFPMKINHRPPQNRHISKWNVFSTAHLGLSGCDCDCNCDIQNAAFVIFGVFYYFPSAVCKSYRG